MSAFFAQAELDRPSEVMVRFVDQHRETYGVEPICAVLPIAPSTYFLRKAQQPATVVEPCEQGLKLEPLDGVVWQAIWRIRLDMDRTWACRIRAWKDRRSGAVFQKGGRTKGSFDGTERYELGRIHRSRDEFFEARRVLKEEIELIPNDERPRLVLADVERVIRARSKGKEA